MKAIICYWQILCILALAASGCHPFLNMQKDMVTLDATYIPVMIISNSSDYEKLRLTLEQFHYAWMEFKQKHGQYRTNGKEWGSTVMTIGRQISSVQVMVKDKKSFGEIQERVSDIRPMLCRLREQADMDYYLDLLIDFDQRMEPVYAVAARKTKSTLTERDIQTIARAFSSAHQAWEALRKQEFDASLYRFDSSKVAVLTNLIQEQTDDMLILEDALKRRSRQDIITTARLMKPDCNRIFWLFGDFSCLSRQFRSAEDEKG